MQGLGRRHLRCRRRIHRNGDSVGIGVALTGLNRHRNLNAATSLCGNDAISAITGVLRSGGDVTWSTVMDVCQQWLACIPLTALVALVLQAGPWPIAIAIQVEGMIKVPLCIWRIGGGKWIHDVTKGRDA